MGDARDMEHDTEERPEVDATVREEGPGDDIDTEVHVGIQLTQDQGANNHTKLYKGDILYLAPWIPAPEEMKKQLLPIL